MFNWFKKKKKDNSKTKQKTEQPVQNQPQQASALRQRNLTICHDNGFKPTSSLPELREFSPKSALDIAKRLHALKSIILWAMVPEQNLPSEVILNFVNQNNLNQFLTETETQIFACERTDENIRNMIGWKFENTWPLAWYFGYIKPTIDGEMMSGEQMQEILKDYTCSFNETVEDWTHKQTTQNEERLLELEDLFYCLHNAVRSAQLGSDTVPADFDPIGNGGVTHERRHSLTWMVTKNSWEDTDLST